MRGKVENTSCKKIQKRVMTMSEQVEDLTRERAPPQSGLVYYRSRYRREERPDASQTALDMFSSFRRNESATLYEHTVVDCSIV